MSNLNSMGEELREALEKHLFNYTWGCLNGAGSKVFPSTDIRCVDIAHKDFTLRASNLKEALAKIEEGNFAVCPLEAPFAPSPEDPGRNDPNLFTASGCPPIFPSATLGLVKAEQRRGTAGEGDWSTFHRKAPWKIIFQQDNKSITWNLVKKVQHSGIGNVREGVNKAEPSLSGNIHQSSTSALPQQYLLKNPLRCRQNEKQRIRRALQDRKV